MHNGTVFNIQKFSVNDGPGIRTTVFLKGCPLNCIWCHNPESKSTTPELMYLSQKCIGCRKCQICPSGLHVFLNDLHQFDRTDCVHCGSCAENCPADALELSGYTQTVEEVLNEVLKDMPFYETSGGGMTLSGGEPMFQFDFSLALLKAAKKKNLHTCLETCGFAPKKDYEAVLPYVDIFLFDYKETNPEKHKEFTGVSNELILKNLKMLDAQGTDIILRCPIIPTLNDREDHFSGIAETANSLKNISEIHIEPYHPLGKGKAEHLGKEYPLKDLSFPEEETVNTWIQTVQKKTEISVKKP